MKVFCPTSCQRMSAFEVPKLFPDDWKFFFVVDQHSDPYPFIAKGHRVVRVHIEDDCRSTRLAEIRNKIEAQVELGEWFIEVDDDIQGITMLDPAMQRVYEDHLDYDDWSAREWHEWFSHRATPAEVRTIFYELITECERLGTIYGGCSFFDNPFYRKKKFAHASYVNGGLHAKRKDGRRWRWTPHEDMEMSCYALSLYGASVVHRWAHGLFKDSSEGGVGTFTEEWVEKSEERIPLLLRAYPGLIKRLGPHRLKITKNSLKSVENWRRQYESR